MATNILDINKSFPIYKEDGTPFYDLVLRKAVYESSVMSLADKITGIVYYKDNKLNVTTKEYIRHKIGNDNSSESYVHFVLVSPPTVIKEGLVSDNGELKGMTKYSFEFYHPMYLLGNLPFSDVAVTTDEQRYLSENKEFSWIGTPNDYIDKLNKNLEETQWVVVKSSKFPSDKNNELSGILQFDKNTIADALKKAYDTWGIPYIIDTIGINESLYSQGKRFKIAFGLPSNEIYESETDRQQNKPFVFKIGQGLGLKNNSRTPRKNKIITRISGYGSEDNIPYGYPQIVYQGGNVQYPLYDGIVGGQNVKLIKHPFTRTHLMPSVYTEMVNRKVNPLASGYNPNIELVDYYDAIASQQYPYVNEINPQAPSYEIHEFEDIKPEFDSQGAFGIISVTPLNKDLTPAQSWDDTMDGDGNYIQSYFKIVIPRLSFDIYACASITQEMKINMRNGACIGCTFDVAVNWDDYKKSFYDEDGEFSPNGEQRDLEKFPNSSLGQIELILQKENATFGTLMPNTYQHPVAGDNFVVLGISLPLSYITEAEHRLDDALKSYMLENNIHYFDYPLKFDEAFLASKSYILDQIRPNSVIRFEYAGEQMALYVKQMVARYDDGVLPKYDITLTDNVDVVLNQIGQVSEDVEKLSSLIAMLRQSYGRNVWTELARKLSKVNEDSAQGLIHFLSGLQAADNIEIGDYTEGLEGGIITPNGFAELEELVIRSKAEIGSGILYDDLDNRVPSLTVNGDTVFSENLSSPVFSSGFLDGYGWAIKHEEVPNAMGVMEDKYTMEIDSVTVRNILRVYELVVSQLRGENDNYIFAAMMEVHHYEKARKRVWLSTEGGKLNQNFRVGDYIIVQRFIPNGDVVHGGDGYITKSYEFIVIAVGSGGAVDEEGGRLDWVEFKNFTTPMTGGTPESLIAKGDTLCRIDNESDPERKGVISITSVGSGAPYMDVMYGRKTNPVPTSYLKSRIGNLEGLNMPPFGWLEGFGAYINNLYGVGKFFNAQTGESMSSRITATNESLKSVYNETTYDITDDENFVSNGFFQDGLDKWAVVQVNGSQIQQDVDANKSINSGNGLPLLVNNMIINSKNVVNSEITTLNGVQVLHVINAGVVQDFSELKINETHKVIANETYQDPEYEKEEEAYWIEQGYTDEQQIAAFISQWKATNATREENAEETEDEANVVYLGVRLLPMTSGTLSVYFLPTNGTAQATSIGYSQYIQVNHDASSINFNMEWVLVQATDKFLDDDRKWSWNDLEGIRKSGKLLVSYTGECYIRFVALSNNPIEDSKVDYNTLIEQTSRKILLQASKQEADKGTLRAELEITADGIRTEVSNNWEKTHDAFERFGIDLDKEGQELEDEYGILATWISQTDWGITTVAANFEDDGTIKANSVIAQRFNSIELSLNAIEESSEKQEFESGTIRSSSPSGKTYAQLKYDSTSFIRFVNVAKVSASTKFYLNSNYKVCLVFFDTNKIYLSITSLLSPDSSTGIVEVTIPEDAVYCAAVIRKQPTSIIYPSEADATGFKMSSFEYVTKAQMGLFIDNFGTSSAKIKADVINMTSTVFNAWTSEFKVAADNINFKTGSFVITNNSNVTTFSVDASGNVSFTGNLNDGTSIGTTNVKVSNTGIQLGGQGSLTKDAIIFQDAGGSQGNEYTHVAGLTSNRILNNQYYSPEFYLTTLRASDIRRFRIYIDSGNRFRIGGDVNGNASASLAGWPTQASQVSIGQIYLDGDVLKVKTQ